MKGKKCTFYRKLCLAVHTKFSFIPAQDEKCFVGYILDFIVELERIKMKWMIQLGLHSNSPPRGIAYSIVDSGALL